MKLPPLFAAWHQVLRLGYGARALRGDISAGLTVGIIAIPLAMALAIAVGVAPQHGLYTVLVAAPLIALTGGSRFNVSGPTAAFVVILLPITQQFGLGGLLLCTMLAGLILIALGLLRAGRLIAFIPYPVTLGFTAGIGIVINALSALLFVKDSKSDLNLRAAFVHLMADAVVSVGVVVAGGIIMLTGLELVDPITSLVITAVIAWSSWGLLRDSLRMGMLGVPANIDSAEVRAMLERQPGVTQVHDLHIWPMSTTETAMTAHLLMPEGAPHDSFLRDLAHDLEHAFGIGHPTIQIETDGNCACPLESAATV